MVSYFYCLCQLLLCRRLRSRVAGPDCERTHVLSHFSAPPSHVPLTFRAWTVGTQQTDEVGRDEWSAVVPVRLTDGALRNGRLRSCRIPRLERTCSPTQFHVSSARLQS